MDYHQILTKAESSCSYLKDSDCTIFYVSASSDNPLLSKVLDTLRAEINTQNIKAEVVSAGSLGLYNREPIVITKKSDGTLEIYPGITPETIAELFKGGSNQEPPVLSSHNRIVLRNCGQTNPENIGEYILNDNGYRGLADALKMDRAKLIQKLNIPDNNSKITDNGYIICYALDCESNELTNRLLLEGDPHSILEGLLISAWTFGAARGIICLNEEYETAIQRLRLAQEQMKEYNLLGNNILESEFSYDIEVRTLPGSMVMKDETALIRYLAGKQPIPYLVSTPLVQSGLDDKPTLISDSESFSRFVTILKEEKVPETRVITLCGDINNKCTVEIPAEITFRQIIKDKAGGVSGDSVKAIQAGGKAGRFLSVDELDISLKEALSDGPGIIEVYNTDSSMVEKTKDIMDYLHTQSCGKCVFCREGTLQIADMLGSISSGETATVDLELISNICKCMKQGSICYLGRKAADPVLSSMDLFSSEYEHSQTK